MDGEAIAPGLKALAPGGIPDHRIAAGPNMTKHYATLLPGDPAPWFHAASTSNPRYAFDTVGGRYIVLCFLGSAADPQGVAALKAINAHRRLFDDERAAFFGVTVDPEDKARVRESLPGVRFLLDFDRNISRLYGSAPREAESGQGRLRRFWIVLDPTLRVLKLFPFNREDRAHEAVFTFLEALPPPDRFSGMPLQAPVLYLPNVFEPGLCAKLVSLHESHGGVDSGFMREVDGKTVLMTEHGHKRRSDFIIEDHEIIRATQARVSRRVLPEIAKAFQFNATRMERYIVACYSAEDGGHFLPHRDNTTKGTAHRRFAVSINLNDDFDGGDLSFPEYGPRGFKPAPGAAVVFSCSLLHTVSKVTRGRRYAFLPFLYDEAAAAQRAENNRFLDESVPVYMHTDG